LIAKNRQFSQRRRTLHFSHALGQGCAAGAETAAHRMAKQILLDANSLTLPEWGKEETLYAEDGTGHAVRHRAPPACLPYESARAEVSLEGLRPDVLLAGDFGDTHELLVEIFVAHAVSDEKKALIRAQHRFAVEICLPRESLSLGLDAFREAVLTEAPREWLCHPQHEAAFATTRAAILTTIARINVRYRQDLAYAEEGNAATIAALDTETRVRVRALLARLAEEEQLLKEAREANRVKLNTAGWELRPDHATRGAKLAERHRHLALSYQQALQCQECCWLNPPGSTSCEECQATRFLEWPLTANCYRQLPYRLNCHPAFRGRRIRAAAAPVTRVVLGRSTSHPNRVITADDQLRLPF
jgi:hypothetical protein